ncbi:DUF669 domain-containing protein [Brevundimonas sp.]|uniref:DUF669 domain-containing protein n=1 Tax=Brevundimonas sp. TaxID=1871086 RepID=UPI0035B108FA
MAALTPFNPDDVQDDREIIPAGNYTAQIIESSLAATKSGGDMLKLTWEIIDGPLAKRRVWENLNIRNQNQQAQEIAERSLKRICGAVGYVGTLTDSEHLHFKPCEITVAIKPAEGQYGEQNIVKGYKALGGGSANQQQAAVGAAPAAGARPWGKSAA